MRKFHWSDCAVNNGPAYPAGPCDCGEGGDWPLGERVAIADFLRAFEGFKLELVDGEIGPFTPEQRAMLLRNWGM